MRKPLSVLLLFAGLAATPWLMAQQDLCRTYEADSPEDELMRGVTGADTPAEQIAALDKYAQAHADSKFMPCVDAFYASAYFKLNNYEKVIEYGEKAVALNNLDLTMMDSTTYAYIATGKVSDTVFDVINKAAEPIQAVANPPRPNTLGEAEWQKTIQDAQTQASDWRERMEKAFYTLLPRVTDPNKRIQLLDSYAKAYPENASAHAAPLHFNYYIAYKIANISAKAAEYGEKAIAADPTNATALNLVAYDYAIGQTNPDKAAEYARKALELIPAIKKPEGAPDDQFKTQQNNGLGMAHLTLGYVAFLKSAKTRKLALAIQELKTAADLLDGSPQLQGQALYYLGYAYETVYPANHRGALDALTRASSLQSSFQGQAQDLLAKVKHATGTK